MLESAVCCAMGSAIRNEDNFCLNGKIRKPEVTEANIFLKGERALEGVYAVCDGMGGESFGSLASYQAVARLTEAIPILLEQPQNKEKMLRLLEKISSSICRESKRRGTTMGTTVVAAVVTANWLRVYNMGDSRAYLYSNGILLQLTRDHTVAQSMKEMGFTVVQSAMHNQLTQYLGMDEQEYSMEPYRCSWPFSREDVLILCSDGLTAKLSDEKLADTLAQGGTLEQMVQSLVQQALNAGSHDNITAMMIRYACIE